MNDDIDAVQEITEQNRQNIRAIGEELGIEGKLDHSTTNANWAGFLPIDVKSDGDLSPEEKLAKMMEENASNLLLIAEELGVKDHNTSGKASKADFSDLLALE